MELGEIVGIMVDQIPEGEEAISERGLILSPGRIHDWSGEYHHDGTSRTLHCGRSASTEVFMTAYLKAASKIPAGDYRWIPVLLIEIQKATANWTRRREILGDLTEAANRCHKHSLFFTLFYQGKPYIMPTQKGISLMTAAGRQIAPFYR